MVYNVDYIVILACPPMTQTNSDFDAKPMVMLLGQYSTGKTTFIKHMLQSSYPGEILYFSADNKVLAQKQLSQV